MSATQEVGDIFGEGKGPAQAMLRSPTVLIVSVGLWGMDVFFFNLFGINYRYVLNYDLMKEQQAHQQQRQQLLEEDAEANSVNSSQAAEPDKQDAFEDEEEFYSPAKQTTDAKAITWCKLVLFSLILLVMLHLTTHLWIDKLGRGMIGAIFSFYGVVLVYIFLPISSNQWLRRAFVITLRRSFELIKPRCTKDTLRPIPFVDVFFADAMCSLSKVFFDWGMLLHMASHYPEPVPNSMHNILIPSACAAVPYLIRARQCVIMLQIGQLKNDPTRYQHLANAIKYSTSIWPLLLSAYQKTIDPAQAKKMEGLLIFLLTVNAVYSLYWDIVMDWGMMQNPTAPLVDACLPSGGSEIAFVKKNSRKSPKNFQRKDSSTIQESCLRPKLRFGMTMSLLIVLTDSILRYSWMLRFATHLFPNADAFVLCTQFLEIFRRAIWNLLRVEWENIKQNNAKQIKARDSLSDHEDDELELTEQISVERLSLMSSTMNAPVIHTTKPVHSGGIKFASI